MNDRMNEAVELLRYILDGSDGFQDCYSERGGHYTKNVCSYCAGGTEGHDDECAVPRIRSFLAKLEAA